MINFKLQPYELIEIANLMAQRIGHGLEAADQEIKCLPTYLTFKDAPSNGRAMVIDLGGTQARAVLVSLRGGQIIVERKTDEYKMPWRRGVPLERETYLGFLTDLIAKLEPPNNVPLGCCFSFPTLSTPVGDARLIAWTKEIFVPDTEGQLVGQMLLEALCQRGIIISHVTVINDTVASLLAGLAVAQADAYIGLIVGTGTNMAALMPAQAVPKLMQENPFCQGNIPVNLESGNFNPPFMTRWDDQVDAESKNPGQHRFEKAVSGAYLGRLFKAVFPESNLEASAGSAGLMRVAYGSEGGNDDEITIARQIIKRSAKLTAAALAGLIQALNKMQKRKSVFIVAEGGLIRNKDSNYLALTAITLKSLLKEMALKNTSITFDAEIIDTNLKGGALATLIKLVQQLGNSSSTLESINSISYHYGSEGDLPNCSIRGVK